MRRMLMILAVTLLLTACETADSSTPSPTPEERVLVLADEGVTLDGQAIAAEGAVTFTHDIIYYEAGRDESYGEGTEADGHTPQEAAAHSVVTIRQPGTYRVSGTLSAGQLAVDLGTEAKTDPNARVTLVLDGVDLTCTVAPALIFYNVYECDTDWVAYDNEEMESYPGTALVDTSAAGANVILAEGAENTVRGSYVARIYKEGTTKKLHKYDGAFYSKMSMNVDGPGSLTIQAENEGLDSELHLTINGGTISIQADNDGINTNEDGVSVTTINGGDLRINAGLGVEGDAIDSNGHLVFNGGTVYTMANERSPDGGIDADGDILLNGGTLLAMGVRNDAVSLKSAQLYMELTFASTLPVGSKVELVALDGTILLAHTTEKTSQAITFSSPELKTDVVYTLTVNGVVQQYTSNRSGGFGPMGGFGGHGMGGNGDRLQPPEGFDGKHPTEPPEGMEGMTPPDFQNGQPPEPPQDFQGGERPQRPDHFGGPGGMGQMEEGEPSTEFILTQEVRSFSGVSDSAQDSGKTAITFTAQVNVTDGVVTVTDIQASEAVDPSHVQLTVADVPSEDYSASCLWSDGEEAIQGILPEDAGRYQLTISVTGDEAYTGTSQFSFVIEGEVP